VLNKNVWFLDPLPRRELPALLHAASAVIVGAAPQLAFDALAAGRPVILTADGAPKDDVCELIESRGAGLGLPAHDIPAAAQELLDFLKDSDGVRRAGHQAAALAAGRFNMDRVAHEIRGAIEDTVAADPRHAVLRRRTLRTKRALDIVLSLTALIVLSPVFVVLAIAVATKLGWPVFFTQARTGLRGRIFRIVKFRSMTEAKDSAGVLLPDAERLTAFGQFLRRTSLDELPELLNVLKGDMSLVGPRPLLPEYLPYYTPEQRRRHDIAPGVTGWSQVNGRNALTWEDKFALDTWYVDNVSLWLDLKILLKTLWIAVTGHGVSADGHATMPRFDEIMARRQGAEDV
jgi:lipopolysaccharide/colanic/teichoic acid biosynthesis glycosyltransferase